jgi:magnesium-protoporphyrin O-methyltransferase
LEQCCPNGSRNTGEIVRYFARRVEKYAKRQKDGLGAESRTIIEALSAQGVAGKSLLEIGCGVGSVTFELLRLGVSKAHGVDLSPEMVATAKELASTMGYSSRTLFEVGDGAETKLPRADIVILDKVMCCYPVLEPLLNNSLSASTSVYGFSVPSDKGVWKVLATLAISFEKVTLWIRRCGAYTYLHSTNVMNSTLIQRGFGLVFEKRVGPWLVRVYRSGQSAS